MRPWISRHLGTLVVGGIVLVALMASSATAALVITGKDIKNGSVTTKDVKNRSLKTADLSTKTLASLKSSPFIGSACQVPSGGGTGKVGMSVDQNGVITLICKTAPVSGLDVDADADGFQRSQECQDGKAAVNPAAVEVLGDKIDNDCDGTADDGSSVTDDDGDGVTIASGDCDDTDATSYAGAPDTFGNGVDNNCDGVDGIAS
jgi:hypothetical protein